MLPKDPYMLLSVINTKLRDSYDDLDDLSASLDIDKSEIIDRLKVAGFSYDPKINQFK